MPRTKVAKSAAKRVREGEDLVDAHVKDLDNRGKLGLGLPTWEIFVY